MPVVVNARVLLQRGRGLTHYFAHWTNVHLVLLVVEIVCIQIFVVFVAEVAFVHLLWMFTHTCLVQRQGVAAMKLFVAEMTNIGVALVSFFLVSE